MRLLRRKLRRPENRGKFQLERVIGLTTTNSNGLACVSANGDVAYLAGCVVVIYNVILNHQMRFLVSSRAPKALTCVACSQGGKFIAAGESGHQPGIIVWEASKGLCIADLQSHKYGVSCIEFSSNGKHLISLGFPHDGFLCLWEWKAGTLLSKVRATTSASPLRTMHFATDGSFFITSGTKHLKHWTIGMQAIRSSSVVGIGTLVMDFKPINPGSLKDCSFIDVTSLRSFRDGSNEIEPIYVLTDSGILCLLHHGLAVKKWVDLKVRKGYALAISKSQIACACSDGIVRLFKPDSLAFSTTLPCPAPCKLHDLSDTNSCIDVGVQDVKGIIYPDAVACKFGTRDKLVVIYGDHSLFVWDVHNCSKVVKDQAFFPHSACIWDVGSLPIVPTIQSSCTSNEHVTDMGAFVTCSADGSIRIWCLDFTSDACDFQYNFERSYRDPSNVYSKELVGVLYNDKHAELPGTGSVEAVDSIYGFRSIAISPDGKYLATGDRAGNLRVYDLHTLKLISYKEAHDAEILSLSFGCISYTTYNDNVENQPRKVLHLASGGRDRLVHIYSADMNFDVVETLDDHSASITCVKFTCNGSKLLSCSADKSVVFRNIELTDAGLKSKRYHQEMASRGTIYDMDINALSNSAVTVGQDKKVSVLSLVTGKSVGCFKAEGETGEPIKARVDPSGTYVTCSHSDKCLRVFNFANGELIAQAAGHGEIITGVTFLPDCRRLISVSGDSCIFVWRLPKVLSRTIRSKCASQAGLKDASINLETKCLNDKTPGLNTFSCGFVTPRYRSSDIYGQEPLHQTLALNDVHPFKFSISRLPHWAKEKVTHGTVEGDDNEFEANSFKLSDSRWAERLGHEGYKLFSENQQEDTPPATIHASGFGIRRRFTVEPSNYQDSTPESSVDSQNSPCPSGQKDAESKKTQWKIVHTVFFDEDSFFQSNDVSERQQHAAIAENKNLQYKHSDQGKDAGNLNASRMESVEDGVVVYLSEDENRNKENCSGVKEASERRFSSTLNNGSTCHQTTESFMHMLTEQRELPMICLDSSHCTRFEKWPEYVKELHTSQECYTDALKAENIDLDINRESNQTTVTGNIEPNEADEFNEDEFTPQRDLFTLHFDKLSTAVKGTISARSSYSTRYFARYSGSMPQMSLFQNSPSMTLMPMSNHTDIPYDLNDQTAKPLLATESDKLKLQKRQDRMATEVEHTWDQNFHPGITDPDTSMEYMSIHEKGEATPITDTDKNSSYSIIHSHNERQQHVSESYDLNVQNRDSSHCILNGLEVQLIDLDPQHSWFKNNIIATAGSIAKNQLSFDNSKGIEQVLLDSDPQYGSWTTAPTPVEHSCFSYQTCLDGPLVIDSAKEVKGKEVVPMSSLHIFSPMEREEANLLPSSDTLNYVEARGRCQSDASQGSGLKDSASKQLLMLEENEDRHLNSELQDSIQLPHSVDDYKAVLQDLAQSADRALLLFKELHSVQYVSQSTCISDLSVLFQELVPPTYQKIQELYECASSIIGGSSGYMNANQSLDNLSQRTSSVGSMMFQSMPGTIASRAPTESILESVDIEGFVERYSLRLSQTLTSQVLSVLQKRLGSEPGSIDH